MSEDIPFDHTHNPWYGESDLRNAFTDDKYLDYSSDFWAERKPIVGDMPTDAAEVIEELILNDPRTRSSEIEKVKRTDPQTVEVVYYGDEFDPEVEGVSRMPSYADEKIREIVQEWFGPHWLVDRKKDERLRDGKSRQRIWIKRVLAYKFRYEDDDLGEFERLLEGQERLARENRKKLPTQQSMEDQA